MGVVNRCSVDDCQMCFVQPVRRRGHRQHWAVVTFSETLPHPPLVVTRFKWYANWVSWWMADEDVVVIPWDVPQR